MSMSAILIAALVMSVLGLLFGALLGVTGRVFKVPVNEKAEALRECLPGANCGACGFPGCDGYAADGKAEVGACAVGGPACAAKMGEIMGVSVSASVRMVASVACQGYGDHCKPKADYQGMTDCVAASLVNNGTKACQYACLGLGTCERACPFDAIHIDPIKQIAVVDEEKCQACKKCVAACPQHVLSMRPAGRVVNVGCHNPEKGIALKEKCDRACIGCEACVKACNFGAIEMENGVPKIDYEKCVGCMACADARPARWKLILRLAKRLISIRASVWAAPCAPDSASSTPSKARSSSRTRFSAHARAVACVRRSARRRRSPCATAALRATSWTR